MATVLTITETVKTLGQIEEKIGTHLSDDRTFFTEWLNLPDTLSDFDRSRLDRVRQNYLYQTQHRNNLYEVLDILRHFGNLAIIPAIDH